MGINNKYTEFEKLLQKKINNFEYPYNDNDWISFNKKLNKKPNHFISLKKSFKFLIIISAIIIPVLFILYYFFITPDNTDNNKNKIYENQKTFNNKIKNYRNNNINAYTNQNNNNNQIKSIFKNSQNINNPKVSENILNDNFDKNNKIKNISNTIENNTINNNVNNAIKTNQLFGEIITADILEGCAPLRVRFNPLISEDTISYLWDFGDGKTSKENSPSHIYNKTGIYKVSLTVKFSKSKVLKKFIFSNNIKVYNPPSAQFKYTFNSDGDIYSFTDNSSNVLSWYWTLGDKSSSLKEKNIEHIYTKDGLYYVKLVVTNSSGCSDSITKEINVSIKPPYECPTGFTPNNDGLNDYFGPIGKAMDPDGYNLSIFDKNGSIIFKTSDIETLWDGKISGSNSEALQGIYFWKINMKNKYGTLQEKTGWVTLIK